MSRSYASTTTFNALFRRAFSTSSSPPSSPHTNRKLGSAAPTIASKTVSADAFSSSLPEPSVPSPTRPLRQFSENSTTGALGMTVLVVGDPEYNDHDQLLNVLAVGCNRKGPSAKNRVTYALCPPIFLDGSPAAPRPRRLSYSTTSHSSSSISSLDDREYEGDAREPEKDSDSEGTHNPILFEAYDISSLLANPATAKSYQSLIQQHVDQCHVILYAYRQGREQAFWALQHLLVHHVGSQAPPLVALISCHLDETYIPSIVGHRVLSSQQPENSRAKRPKTSDNEFQRQEKKWLSHTLINMSTPLEVEWDRVNCDVLQRVILSNCLDWQFSADSSRSPSTSLSSATRA